jgi:hypothetical protein
MSDLAIDPWIANLIFIDITFDDKPIIMDLISYSTIFFLVVLLPPIIMKFSENLFLL